MRHFFSVNRSPQCCFWAISASASFRGLPRTSVATYIWFNPDNMTCGRVAREPKFMGRF